MKIKAYVDVVVAVVFFSFLVVSNVHAGAFVCGLVVVKNMERKRQREV